MADPVTILKPKERRAVERMAADCGVGVADMVAAITAAWLRLAHDAPGALPRDPLSRLGGRATRGGV